MSTSAAPLTLMQVFSAILRHKVKSFLVFVLVMMISVALFIVWPRTYQSEGKLFVQRGGNSNGLSPIAPNADITIQDSHETEIRSVAEILKSRGLKEAVVDRIGVEEILKSPLDELLPKITLPGFLKSRRKKSIDGFTPEDFAKRKRREEAIEKLHKSALVYSEKQTSVITVYLKGSTPQLAQKLVQAFFEEAQKVYLEVHSVKGSTAFFEEQAQAAEKAYQMALAEQEEFRNRLGVMSVGAKRGTLESIVSQLEQQIITAEIELESVNKQVDRLTNALAGTQAQVPLTTSGVVVDSNEDARTELFRARAELERESNRLSANHPTVRQLRKTVDRMEAMVGNLRDNRVESETRLNPIYEEIKVDLTRAEATQASAKARLASLKEKYAAQTEKQAAMIRHEIQAGKLADQVGTARQQWELFKDKGIEALAKSKIDESELSTIVVQQKPDLIVEPISPKASMFLSLGAVLGVMAGLAVALFFERNHLSGSLDEGEVEQILEMPVLVALPRVYSSRNMVN